MEASEEANTRLTADLNSAQRRLQALEIELKASNEAKRGAESRLTAIHSLLRRFFGFRQGQNPSPMVILRSKLRVGGDTSGGDETDDALTHPLHQNDRRSRSISPRKGE